MAYTIFNTRNNELAVVEDGTIDNTTDLKLIGKNYAGYGEIQNENFVYLLENFAGANQPPRPIAGQLWFDTSDKKIKLYDGNDENVFVPLGNMHIGALPTGAAITAANVNKGDLWYDDVNGQIYVHNGATSGDPFVLVGPKGSQDVKTDIEDVTVYDNLFAGQADPTPYQHKILKGWVDDVVVFIASNDEFTLDDSNAIGGFDRIKKGVTLVNTELANDGVTAGNYSFHGSAANALRLGGTLAAEFVQRSNPVFVTQVDIDDNDGLQIGPNNEVLLKVSGNEGILESTITNAKFNFKVKDGSGSTVTPLTLTSAGLMPASDNNFSIGSASLRWSELHVANLKGIADKADTVLSDGTYKIATRTNTADALVTRDSVGDIYGNAFRGTALYNSTDAAAALTARVTRSDSVLLDGTDTYISATTASTASKLVARDANGEVFANQFNGLATRAATMRVSTGVDQFEYRSASVANLQAEPNTVAVRDNNGKLFATEFVGGLNGAAATANQWSTARTITVDGDASGTVTLDGSQDVTLTIEVGANQIALGTDTTGNYVQSVAVYNSDPYMNVYVNNTLDGSAREAASITLGIDADVAKSANTLVARGASNEINVGEVTADDISGSTITATTRFEGQVNDTGTSNDGYFNNLYATNISFGASGTTLPITTGGTGATTAPDARTNLDVYSKSEVDSAVSSAVGSISTTSIVNGSSNVAVVSSGGNTVVTRGGTTHSTFSSSGITLSQGVFVGDLDGNAASANYADLAEMYTTDGDTPPGTVVMVCDHEGHELEACTDTGYPVGVVSTDPAFLMNSKLENGVAIALKGRVPTRVVGAVNKGDLLFAGANGCAVKNGVYKVAVALESNDDEGEKLVECMLVV